MYAQESNKIRVGLTNLPSSPPTVAGLCGLALSMIGFAFSTQYWAIILSRCAQGALNGNIGKFLLCYSVPLIAIDVHIARQESQNLVCCVLYGVVMSADDKSSAVMGEITNASNRAQGFAFMPFVWTTGC